MARVVLGVTGSVAAIRTPELFGALRTVGHEVKIVTTGAARYFFDAASIADASAPGHPSLPDRSLLRDEDEWPGPGYRRGDPVLHIELRKWADLLVVAPLDANTLAKFAVGFSDNLLSCLYRAWDFTKPVILAPAMNTLMWDSPVTARHLRQILADRSASRIPDRITLDDITTLFAEHLPGVVLIPPQSKRLACGDLGVGAMADVATISSIIQDWASMNDRLSS